MVCGFAGFEFRDSVYAVYGKFRHVPKLPVIAWNFDETLFHVGNSMGVQDPIWVGPR